MGVRGFKTAVDPRPLLGQRGQAVDAVDAMQLFDIARNQPAFGVVPGALADAIAGINGRGADASEFSPLLATDGQYAV